MNVLFAIATGIMFGMGVFLLLRRDLIKAAMGFYVLFASVNLFFLAVGAFNGKVPAYVNADNQTVGQPSDPTVQALMLTAVVISFGSFALLMSFIAVISRRYKTIDTNEVNHLKA